MEARTGIGALIYTFGWIELYSAALTYEDVNLELTWTLIILGFIFVLLGAIVRGFLDTLLSQLAFLIYLGLLALILLLPLWIILFVLINVYKLVWIRKIFLSIIGVVFLIFILFSFYFWGRFLFTDPETRRRFPKGRLKIH